MKVQIIDDVPVTMTRVVVLDFKIDASSPERYVQDHIDMWRDSPVGQWVIKNSRGKLEIYKMEDPQRWLTKVKVIALLADKDAVYYQLKWN